MDDDTLAAMQTLAEAVAAFQRHLAGALATPPDNNRLPSWRPERVTLSLEVVLDEGGIPRVTSGASGAVRPAGFHTVTIEFLVSPRGELIAIREPAPASLEAGGADAPARTVGAAAAAEDQTEANERAAQKLANVFGAPGFDSSARAAVFCDAVRALTPEQSADLPSALVSPAQAVADDALRRARHLILGVVRSGPLKSPERASALLAALLETRSISAITRLIEERWNTSDTWAD